MHHRPAGPPPSARMAGALNRGAVRTRGSAMRGVGRLALGMAVTTTVTGLVLAVPVVSSGSGTSPMALDSSSSSAERYVDESSPVVMGRDGLAAPSAAADSAAAPPATEAPEVSAAAPGTPTDVPASAAQSTPASPAAATPATPARAATAAVAAPSPNAEAEVLALVNTARARAGCDPLAQDEGLATVARAHSADMRDRDFFGHVNPDDLDPFDRAEAAGQTNADAENIARGQSDPAKVMSGWMDSSDHRENILDCDLRTLGVGVAEGPGGPWWTQLFGD